MSAREDRAAGRVAWPWAVFLLIVSLVAAVAFVFFGLAENTKTATTTGRLDDSHSVSTDGGPDCVGQLTFTVYGNEYGGTSPSGEKCPDDGSDPTVTVHYDPEVPSSYSTQARSPGSSTSSRSSPPSVPGCW